MSDHVIEGLSGIEQIRALRDGTSSWRGIAHLMDFKPIEVEDGVVVFEGHPSRAVYNPIGSVHGGYAATLLDSAMGCAVQTRLAAGQGYTTLELKIAYHRALSDKSGPVRAEGRVLTIGKRAAFAEGKLFDKDGVLCASGTTTCLVFGS